MVKKLHILKLFVLLLFFSAFAFGSESKKKIAFVNDFAFDSKHLPGEQDRSVEIDNIRESVFRYQFKHIGSGWVKVYFLSFGEDKAPNDKFMKRFKGHKPSVKKVSQSIFNDGIKDKETGETGLILRVTSIKWIDDNEVQVDGGYYEDVLSSSGNTYTVKRENGKWIVKKDVMNWIS